MFGLKATFVVLRTCFQSSWSGVARRLKCGARCTAHTGRFVYCSNYLICWLLGQGSAWVQKGFKYLSQVLVSVVPLGQALFSAAKARTFLWVTDDQHSVGQYALLEYTSVLRGPTQQFLRGNDQLCKEFHTESGVRLPSKLFCDANSHTETTSIT